jgi:ribosomal protein S18 acetylase RimI-like enzyme
MGFMTNHRKLEVRPATTNEHRYCAAIYAEAWKLALPDTQRTISLADFKSEVEGERVLVAALNERIVGYVSIWEPDWFIHHLYVDPKAHRAGVGKMLVSHTLALATSNQVSLKCQIANVGALRFYRSVGFMETREVGSDEYGRWVRLEKHLA